MSWQMKTFTPCRSNTVNIGSQVLAIFEHVENDIDANRMPDIKRFRRRTSVFAPEPRQPHHVLPGASDVPPLPKR